MPENCVILLVEDDPNDAFFVQRALKDLGFPGKLKHVTDSQEARDYLATASPAPQVIVADSALCVSGSGIEFLEWVRKSDSWRQIPFIVLSGGMTDEMRKRAAQAGATAVMTKATALLETSRQLREILSHLPANCREWLKPE
jgi:CheY-like chemotaxis protein